METTMKRRTVGCLVTLAFGILAALLVSDGFSPFAYRISSCLIKHKAHFGRSYVPMYI
jgi:hypothetical protein